MRLGRDTGGAGVTRIRTLVVDDEPLARQGLRVRLGRESDIDVVGEAEDGPAAVRTISTLRPDLVFLDVQMPGFDGFEVLSRIAADHLPSVVFVTAYEWYALRAFGVHALDYLLKPIEHRRFQETLRRARAGLAAGADATAADRLRGLLEARDADSEEPRVTDGPALRFTVRDGERYVLLRVGDLDWVEADANYLRLHAADRTFKMRMTMSELERKLDARQFARIHVHAGEPRSHRVNRTGVSRGLSGPAHERRQAPYEPGTRTGCCDRSGR